MNRLSIGIVPLALLLCGSVAVGCRPRALPAAQAPAVPTASEALLTDEGSTVAMGRVTPLRSAALSVADRGIVAEVLVEEGQPVEAGQVLLRLEAEPLKAAVAEAEAGLREKEAVLAAQPASAATADLAAAKAAVAASKATLGVAQAMLAQSELRAPFAGTVVSLSAKAGERVDADQPLVMLADLSAWQVETLNVNEMSIAHIHQGDPATVTVDALPGQQFTGKVVHVQGLGREQRGEIVFPVTIVLDRADPTLRWNMTATITIRRH